MAVRRLFALALTIFFSLTALASESDDQASFVDASVPHAGVTITPIPMPAAVTEVLPPINPTAKLRAAKKAKQATKEALPITLLSRTERHQMALMVARHKNNEAPAHSAGDEDEGQSHDDEHVLQQFYSRPRVIKDDKQDDPEADLLAISDTARIRLMMARLKAVEAHVLAQVDDDGEALPQRVTDRLKEARAKALEVHRARFS
ncbi:hypothetical protein AB6Q56_06045 [Dechloromonas sp. ARDL1]|uniref:hypothetical protein n=1 Tax=Dechloromonas sp. ARDL1 TaxID=3322121 RepID=UPI003DA7283D